MIKNKNTKKAYIISCPSLFRDQIDVLCRRKKVNAGDIARSIILTIDKNIIEETIDPGEPDTKDREAFFAKSDKKKSKPIKRKPRIQLRLPEGFDTIFIRKALNLALLLNQGNIDLFKSDKNNHNHGTIEELHEENERLKATIFALMFEPLKTEITTKAEALHILGYAPFARPTPSQIKQRFRMLATIHHPDSELGSNERMLELNAAFNFLKNNPII